MTDTWTVQNARTHFSELLDAAIAHGPQIVTRRGVELVAVISIERWRALQRRAQPTIKDRLFASGAPTEHPAPPRKRRRRRKSPQH